MALRQGGPFALVACPGDVDYIQGVGDFEMRASVRWDPKAGSLEVQLVHSDDQPYAFRVGPPRNEAGIRTKPGLVEIGGGSYSHFIRVRNLGDSRVPYRLVVDGIWGE